MIKIRPLNESDEGDIAQILNKTWNFDGENDELLESRMYFLECMTNKLSSILIIPFLL